MVPRAQDLDADLELIEAGKVARAAAGNVKEGVYEGLKGSLIGGRLMPGQLVSIRSVAKAFGTSTMPVREALNRLRAEGVLTAREGGLLSVPQIDRATLEELRWLRRSIEGAAAEIAAAQLGKAGIEELEALYRKMQAIELGGRSAPERRQFLSLNQQFHFAIYAGAGSPMAMRLIEGFWARIGPYFNLLSIHNAFNYGQANHRAMIDAIIARDGAACRSAVEQDIEGSYNFFRSIVG